MEKQEIRELEDFARQLRMDVLEEVYGAGSGHLGGSLSICDTLAYLYRRVLRLDPATPRWEDRDRLVLSKGHASPALYAALAETGFFPWEELKRFRKLGGILQGHPDMKRIPGVDMTTGSLGQGISAAVGMAIAGKITGKPYRVFAILGDGELQEGQVWEAAMLAAHRDLDNLTAIVDNNGLQIDGPVEKVNSPYPIDEKFRAFGWETFTADAHSFPSLEGAFAQAAAVTGKPAVIIQRSIKGKGVSFMEGKASWHGTPPNEEQYSAALAELKGGAGK